MCVWIQGPDRSLTSTTVVRMSYSAKQYETTAPNKLCMPINPKDVSGNKVYVFMYNYYYWGFLIKKSLLYVKFHRNKFFWGGGRGSRFIYSAFLYLIPGTELSECLSNTTFLEVKS